jgi:SAM-dependent methyltransferase
MTSQGVLAPGVPADYYRRIRAAEQEHWWYRGMREITRTLLGADLHAGLRLLDVGCGTGGFLRWALDHGRFESVAGVDIASAALDLAAEQVPGAELRQAPLDALPFADCAFDLVVANDVLQHVEEWDVRASLQEAHRVLAPSGVLLLRTGGARRLRAERSDWRAYDAATMRRELVGAGFEPPRLTYANMLPSLLAAVRRHRPHAPSEKIDGIPLALPGPVVDRVGMRLLELEAQYLSRPAARLPYGHTLFAVARSARR